MKASDFEFDHNEFEAVLARTSRDCTRATERLIELFELWEGFADRYFDKKVAFVRAPDGSHYSGEIISKKFTVRWAQVALNNRGYAEVLATTQTLGGETSEIARFLISSNGALYSSDAEELHSSFAEYHAYKAFIVLLRRVLSQVIEV